MSKIKFSNFAIFTIFLLLLSANAIPGTNISIDNNYFDEGRQDINNNLALKINQIPYDSMDTDSWPMFHHDLKNSGYSNSNAPDAGVVKWSFNLGNSVSSPAVYEGKVYIGDSSGKIYCLDAYSGTEIWSYSSDDGIYFSAPAIYDDKVYFNEADEIICLDAVNGDFIWSVPANGGWSSPAITEGKIYFGSDNDKIYCLNAYTGSEIWNYQTGDKVESSPAVVNGKVFIGSDDYYVYCLNADSGSEIWSFHTGGSVVSSPAVVNNKVYVGSEDGYIYCIDENSGDEIWSYTPCCVKISSPAVAYGKVFAGTTCGASVDCLDAETGVKLWGFQTGGHIWSAPAVADGKVYFGSLDMNIYCLFAETGNEIWSWETGADVVSAPAIAYENLYISSNDGRLYCFTSENQNPVALFDWDPMYPDSGETVTFDASESYDVDGSIDLYEWDWNNDGTYDESHTSPITTHIWYEDGLYYVTLRVTDNDGATGIQTKQIYVGMIPPDADFSWTPEIPDIDETVTFDASDSSDPDGTIILYEWDWNDDGTFDESKTVPTVEHSWSEEGRYTVALKVTDNDYLTDVIKKSIYVGITPPNAYFTWTPHIPKTGQIVTFDASGSTDPDGEIVLYEWDWDNDGTYDHSSTFHLAHHTWYDPGDYLVTLKVTDNSDAYDTETNNIHVINRPPIGNFEWTPIYPFPDETITFDASSSYDPDGFIALYEWDWNNDGTYDESSSSPIITHSWSENGDYPIKLKVTDNRNLIHTVSKIVKVSGEIITNSNWGDGNYSGDTPGSFLTYKLKEWHGYEISNNKAWSQVDLNVWIPIFRDVNNKFYKSNPTAKFRTINFPLIQKFANFLLKIISRHSQMKNSDDISIKIENEQKSKTGGRHGLSWASVGVTYTATISGKAYITLKGRLKGSFTTDRITGSKVDNSVVTTLHVVEKDSYIPEVNEGEMLQLYSFNFTSDKRNIDEILDKGFEMNLTAGKEYLIYLKLKTYTSLSPKRPILDGFFSSSAFGIEAADSKGAEFSFIGVKYL